MYPINVNNVNHANYGDINAHHPEERHKCKIMKNVFCSIPHFISNTSEPKRHIQPKRSFKRDPDSESTTLTTTKLNFIIRVGNHLAMVGVAPLHKVVNPSSCKSLVNFG